MKKISNNLLVILCAVTYFTSYLTRINYGAVLVEMVADTGFTKAALSVALTGSFITYGIGQIISGFIGDKIQPKRLVFIGILISSAVNIMIPFCALPWQMSVLWSLNGFAQAFMWPPMVRLLCSLLTDKEYQKATVKVSYGSSLGTVAVFLISPLLISLWGWRTMFFFSAAMGVIVAIVWNLLCVELPKTIKTANVVNAKKTLPTTRFRVDVMFILIMIGIVLQGALRDGVTTWTPTYIDENYHLGSELAILTSVVLPFFSMFCHGAGGWLYYRILKNPILAAGAIFGLGCVSATVLYFFGGAGPIVSIICLAVLVGAMHGVNLMLICMVPSFYKNTGRISLVSGLLNSCTYVGSAISTYGIALLSADGGWGLTVLVWCMIALAGTLLCFVTLPLWNRKFGKQI